MARKVHQEIESTARGDSLRNIAFLSCLSSTKAKPEIHQRRLMKILTSLFLISTILPSLAKGNDHALQVEQITQGPNIIFMDTLPRSKHSPNGNERYIVALRSTFHDHLPAKENLQMSFNRHGNNCDRSR